MVTIIDTSVWIDYLRSSTSSIKKQEIDSLVNLPEAHLCEPVLFELLRSVNQSQRKNLSDYFSTFPILTTPDDLWKKATALGQKCRDKGFNSRPLDLLISQIAISHRAILITFDKDFEEIARHSALVIRILGRQ